MLYVDLFFFSKIHAIHRLEIILYSKAIVTKRIAITCVVSRYTHFTLKIHRIHSQKYKEMYTLKLVYP